ncbi:uncharacterized protein L203_106169 [Cryptococcus depauperatus CBS 7841]|uniref:Phytase n=1 Tax=Cryptococcus depauperatus CBS 7841 TaxID=1295531 RepID=A0AAJ8JZ13_9TREE
MTSTPTSSTPLLQPQQSASPAFYKLLTRKRRQKKRDILLLTVVLPTIAVIIIAFLVWDVSSLGNCYALPLCQMLDNGRGAERGWWENQGPYAPFRSMGKAGAQAGLPRGCEIDQVTLLQRHTARFPTSKAAKCMLGALEKLDNREIKMPRLHPEFAFLTEVDFSLKDWRFDNLTDQGRKAAWNSGRQIAAQYKGFLRKAKDVFSRSSGGERVIETSRYWLEGFRQHRFILKDKSQLPHVDLIIPEGNSFNNTLSVHSCPAFNALNPSPGELAQRQLTSSLLMPALHRLNNVLCPRPRLRIDELVCLADMCAFDSQARGTNWKGWSKWCSIFTQDEWEILGHGKDIKRFYEVGQGSEYGPTMGAGYINEIIARLTDSAPVDHTITNRTLDNNEATFPRGGELFFIDFGHDNEMLAVMAALGILKQHRPPPIDQVPPKRTYTLSHIVPFGARLTFERITCDTGNWEPDRNAEDPENRGDGMKGYVRILVNDEVHQISNIACEQSSLAEHGLCEIDAFVESQYFATTSVNWNICFTENDLSSG